MLITQYMCITMHTFEMSWDRLRISFEYVGLKKNGLLFKLHAALGWGVPGLRGPHLEASESYNTPPQDTSSKCESSVPAWRGCTETVSQSQADSDKRRCRALAVHFLAAIRGAKKGAHH